MLKQVKYLVVALGLIGGAMGASQAVADDSGYSCNQKGEPYNSAIQSLTYHLECTCMVDSCTIQKAIVNREAVQVYPQQLRFGQVFRVNSNGIFTKIIELQLTINGKTWVTRWTP